MSLLDVTAEVGPHRQTIGKRCGFTDLSKKKTKHSLVSASHELKVMIRYNLKYRTVSVCPSVQHFGPH